MMQARPGFTSEAKWLRPARARQTLIGDKNCFGRDFERQWAEQDQPVLTSASSVDSLDES